MSTSVGREINSDKTFWDIAFFFCFKPKDWSMKKNEGVLPLPWERGTRVEPIKFEHPWNNIQASVENSVTWVEKMRDVIILY